MSKNIIVCCDGTGNEIKKNESNVLKFYRLLRKDETQVAFYHPGVGTISDSSAWEAWKINGKAVFGLATGWGLDENVLAAYRFLLRSYAEGDNIYLLGFSRGAYTVRMLAGFIQLIGLLKPEEGDLCSYALTAYKRAASRNDFTIAWRVQEVLETSRPTIRFMGCWDTVASVIVPRPDRLYLPSLQDLPYTHMNPSVQCFRHAISIDERRRMFRSYRWDEPQKFKSNPYMKDEDAAEQDIRQVWFAGVHSDIGGGYPEPDSGAAKIPLKWMVDEARDQGLGFREELYKRLVLGQNRAGSTRTYTAPDPAAKLHNSMTGAWPILEWMPKADRWKEWMKRVSFLGHYLPRSEPRSLPEGAELHPSVWKRRETTDYDPVNLPNPPAESLPDPSGE